MAIDITRAKTPPSLFGIDRKIAYANRKYHSGWIWTGVTRGLAGIKLSGSPSRYGACSERIISLINKIIAPTRSLKVKYGWNGNLSMFLEHPSGLFDPVWWRKRRWTITSAETINGRTKWNAKKRVNVALSTANPPQIHCTIKFPKYGIADTRLVITVAPQNDICPHGKTYPRKAVAITIKKIVTPDIQVSFKLYDL